VGDVAAAADDLRADLYQLSLRLVSDLDRLGVARVRRTFAESERERMKLKADGGAPMFWQFWQ
jgi:hypothetical protein